MKRTTLAKNQNIYPPTPTMLIVIIYKIVFFVKHRKEMYMEFLKKFFNDDSTIVGLCKFNMPKTTYKNVSIPDDIFFNPFQSPKAYETNFDKNILLI
jgi:hypothetical protein